MVETLATYLCLLAFTLLLVEFCTFVRVSVLSLARLLLFVRQGVPRIAHFLTAKGVVMVAIDGGVWVGTCCVQVVLLERGAGTYAVRERAEVILIKTST